MNKSTLACVAAMALLGGNANAQPAARPDSNQVVVPEVERREVKWPNFPSTDIAVGAFAGTYATQNFGASTVTGLRLGYHITEDWFVEATLAKSKVSDEAFRQVLPGGIFTNDKETLRYYSVSAGYNLLPGEVFFSSKLAKRSAVYLITGLGSTRFNEQRRQTVNFGMGMRLLMTDRAALQVDMRDHMFSLDLLGKRQRTHNLEMTGGLTVYF